MSNPKTSRAGKVRRVDPKRTNWARRREEERRAQRALKAEVRRA